MKKLLITLICIAMMLTIAPIAAFAAEEQELIIADTTSTFATDAEAFDGDVINFRAIADGKVTIQISACTPGYYLEIYEGDNWVSDHSGASPDLLTLDVSSGMNYELIISSYDVDEESQVMGAITYQIRSAVVTTEMEPDEPDVPSNDKGDSESNPIQIGDSYNMSIDAGQAVWFNYHNDASSSKTLHINGRTNYTVNYNGNEIPVDQDGYVNYLMDAGTDYLFSVTNNGVNKVYFTISFSDRAAYVDTKIKISLGDNDLPLSEDAETSLYEFVPSQTGEYLFTVDNGVVGNWGTSFNPVDNTINKEKTLKWTCTSVGQSVMIGVKGAPSVLLNVLRTADYTPPAEVPWEYYKFTYDFSYEIPYDAEIVDIDVTDAISDVAVLDQNGFYRYGSANGPLMVADLGNVEINILDAYNYGQLRAYIYDDKGNVTARVDYNDAMYEYALYGLAPLTKELAVMIKQVGDTQSWWKAGGFVFEDSQPLNEESAWMAFCSYIKGSELENDGNTSGGSANNGQGSNGNSNSGGNTVTGSDQHSNPSGSNGKNPGTADLSVTVTICVMLLSLVSLIVMVSNKKRFLI